LDSIAISSIAFTKRIGTYEDCTIVQTLGHHINNHRIDHPPPTIITPPPNLDPHLLSYQSRTRGSLHCHKKVTIKGLTGLSFPHHSSNPPIMLHPNRWRTSRGASSNYKYGQKTTTVPKRANACSHKAHLNFLCVSILGLSTGLTGASHDNCISAIRNGEVLRIT
jgi:hypothetical protein